MTKNIVANGHQGTFGSFVLVVQVVLIRQYPSESVSSAHLSAQGVIVNSAVPPMLSDRQTEMRVGRDGSPESFDSIGGTAEFTNHISIYKEGVGRYGSPEGFDSIGRQLNSQITLQRDRRVCCGVCSGLGF